MRAVAKKGGVSGVFFMPYLNGGKQPTAADVIRHLEHMIEVAGEDDVSIGTDGSVSAEVVDEEFKDIFAGFVRRRQEAGISSPGESEEGYLFANELNTPRRCRRSRRCSPPAVTATHGSRRSSARTSFACFRKPGKPKGDSLKGTVTFTEGERQGFPSVKVTVPF